MAEELGFFVDGIFLRESWYSVRGNFTQCRPGWVLTVDQGPGDACVLEFWFLADPSFVGVAIELVWADLWLLWAQTGLEKRFFWSTSPLWEKSPVASRKRTVQRDFGGRG